MINGSLLLVFFHDSILDPVFKPEEIKLGFCVNQIVNIELNIQQNLDINLQIQDNIEKDLIINKIIKFEIER